MRILKLRVVVALAVVAMLATACGDDDDAMTAAPPSSAGTAATTAAPADEPVRGGTLRVNILYDATRGLDPINMASMTTPAGDGWRGFAIYDFLAYVDPQTSEVKPRLATSWSSDSTATTWT